MCVSEVLLGLALACHPQIKVDERIERYAITGNNATSLAAQMAQYGPLHGGKRRAWAHTRWNLHSHYVLEREPGHCRLAKPAVTLTLVMTLPEFKKMGAASSHLERRWDLAYQNIVAHEQEHRRHAHAAAHEIQHRLAGLPERSHCGALDRDAQRVIRESIRRARQRSIAFDRSTDSGARTGIVPEKEPSRAPQDAGLVN